jgi:hypothetical protein
MRRRSGSSRSAVASAPTAPSSASGCAKRARRQSPSPCKTAAPASRRRRARPTGTSTTSASAQTTARTANRAIRASAARLRHVDEPAQIRRRLETGETPPLADPLPNAIGVFVSGHTHAPALTNFDRPTGGQGAVVNSGCWLRQLQPISARLGVPAVFVSRFIQTHVRVYRDSQGTHVELWDHPRPATQRFSLDFAVFGAIHLPTTATGAQRSISAPSCVVSSDYEVRIAR